MIESTYSSLVEHQYPNPRKYGTTIIASKDYFFDVMMDDELEMKTRLDAAQTYGVASSLVSALGFLAATRADKVFIKAIDKYHRTKFSGKDGDFEIDPNKVDFSNIETADDVINAMKSLKSD